MPIHEDFFETTGTQFLPREEVVHQWRKRFRSLGTGKAYFKQVSDPNLYRLAIRYLPPDGSLEVERAVEELLQKNYEEGPFVSSVSADQVIARLQDELLRGPIERILSEDSSATDLQKRHDDLFDN